MSSDTTVSNSGGATGVGSSTGSTSVARAVSADSATSRVAGSEALSEMRRPWAGVGWGSGAGAAGLDGVDAGISAV